MTISPLWAAGTDRSTILSLLPKEISNQKGRDTRRRRSRWIQRGDKEATGWLRLTSAFRSPACSSQGTWWELVPAVNIVVLVLFLADMLSKKCNWKAGFELEPWSNLRNLTKAKPATTNQWMFPKQQQCGHSVLEVGAVTSKLHTSIAVTNSKVL